MEEIVVPHPLSVDRYLADILPADKSNGHRDGYMPSGRELYEVIVADAHVQGPILELVPVSSMMLLEEAEPGGLDPVRMDDDTLDLLHGHDAIAVRAVSARQYPPMCSCMFISRVSVA